jgi:pyruvate dehydrogenase E2 component (dihydrolipoamide acetyltransferase)
VLRVAGKAGDVITTGAWLVEMELDESLPQRAEAADTGHAHGHGGGRSTRRRRWTRRPPWPKPRKRRPARRRSRTSPNRPRRRKRDAGTVVGAMQSSDAIRSEAAVSVGGVKAMPAVRALGQEDGRRLVARAPDRRRRRGSRRRTSRMPPPRAPRASGARRAAPRARPRRPPTPPPAPRAPMPAPSRSEAPVRATAALDADEPIRGVRRNMVRTMSAAHAEVVPTTLMDDADLHSLVARRGHHGAA